MECHPLLCCIGLCVLKGLLRSNPLMYNLSKPGACTSVLIPYKGWHGECRASESPYLERECFALQNFSFERMTLSSFHSRKPLTHYMLCLRSYYKGFWVFLINNFFYFVIFPHTYNAHQNLGRSF